MGAGKKGKDLFPSTYLSSSRPHPATGGYHTENVQAMFPLAVNEYVLPIEIPAVRHISACADMAFVSEAQVNVSLLPKIYKFLQLEGLYLSTSYGEGIPLRRFLIRLYLAPVSLKNVRR